MTMSPQDVRATRFREGWRGYDEDEVDDFLSRVAHALQVLITERDEAMERADRFAREAENVLESERLLRRTLLTAERTAEETVQRAQVESDRIRSEARAEAERLRIDAHDRARRQLEQAAEMTDRIRQSVHEFRAFRDDYVTRLRSVITDHLAAVEGVGELPELPDQVAEFERLEVNPDDGLALTAPADEAPSVLSLGDDLHEDPAASADEEPRAEASGASSEPW